MDNDYKQFNAYLNSLPLEELQARNKEELAKNAEDFERFRQDLLQGRCSLCGYSLTHFSDKKPCLHWLLDQTKGFKKRHFPLLYEQNSYHQINIYLRWVANSGGKPIQHINDLVEDKASSKFIEVTIQYKNVEWSFSCSHGDMAGHKNSREGQMPHYHFQMKVDSKVVINYNAFHIPFNDYDHFCFAVARGEFDRLRTGQIEGAGMQTLYELFEPEDLLNRLRKSPDDDESRMPFRLQTMIEADEGTTISGDDLADIVEEHNRTGVPLAKLIRRLDNVRAATYITPGPGVPEIAARTPNRKRGG